ncbi:hypothetical protein L3Q82_012491, partial [Scortum barcoo]
MRFSSRSCGTLDQLYNLLHGAWRPGAWRESSLGTTGFHLCFLQMMLSCWLHQARTFSMYWGGFAAECEAAGMRISTSKSEAMVLDRKRVVCPLRVVWR